MEDNEKRLERLASPKYGEYEDIKAAEKHAKEIIMTLPEKTRTSAFDIAKQMQGGMNLGTIGVAEDAIRRMNYVIRESDGRTFIMKMNYGKPEGSWLMKKGS